MTDQSRNKVQRFTDLEVWRRSHELFLCLLFDLDVLPNTRAAAILTDQSIRAVGSIGANIAEGFNRSKAKYLNCLDIGLGEANETENWLYKLRDSNLLVREKANGHVAETIEIQKMLSGLYRSISRRSS
ncbi:MAG TPA: four helix bundle protein [Lacipirellulaceae bacterium]